MAAMRGARVPVGSATWIAEERSSAMDIVKTETEEFSYSVRNEFDWLNEHMADVFNENAINVAEMFKTPGKLRGKTPRTARKVITGEPRVPLSDIFSSASKGAPTPFTQQLGRLQSPKLQASSSRSPLAKKIASPLRPLPSARPQPTKSAVPPADSGYYGSQSQDVVDGDLHVHATQSTQPFSPVGEADTSDQVAFHVDEPSMHESPTATKTMQSPTMTFQTAREEQTTRAMKEVTQKITSPIPNPSPVRSPTKQTSAYPIISPPSRFAHSSSPKKSSPLKTSPTKHYDEPMSDAASDDHSTVLDEARSPSEGSSPIRPVVRKSSLNFASLPAREPLTHKKSIGARQSRASYDNRQSYLGRHTGGKSLSNVDILGSTDDEEDFQDGMELDGILAGDRGQANAEVFADTHNKVYTQRLQDQISLLGKSQPNASRPSKSIPSSTVPQAAAPAAPAPEAKSASAEKSPVKTPAQSPAKKKAAPPTPGAFPDDDDEEDWIAPPPVPAKDTAEPSPRPTLPKSHTADIMEGIHGVDSVGGAEFVLPKQRQADSRSASPQRGLIGPERTAGALGHGKSASVSVLPNFGAADVPVGFNSPKKTISVSNPSLASVSETGRPQTPKSPSRSFRDSPLKQVKNKLSSIIKSSRGLLASSAVISAEGKSMISPSSTRLGFHADPSTSSLATLATNAESLYPDLSQRAAPEGAVVSSSGSPTRPVAKRTRASTEREKEEKRREKETQKETRLMNEQMDKLEKARQKEREKARVFSKEQERIAAMEKKVTAQKEQEVAQTPAPKQDKPTRTSPRKTKAQLDAAAKAAPDADVDMNDAPGPMAPPSVPRSAGPSQATRAREVRRPLKPTKEAAPKSRQAPTVIRVNTQGSQHSQYHPSTSALSSNLHDTLGASQPQLKSKASQASLQQKPSLSSLRGSTASASRPKALDLAAKRKEAEEKEAQRKRDAKAEMDRKRAALQEEEKKQEQQKRLEAEKQKTKEREQAASQAEAKKNAQRQAAIERAKQTRAPPPAVRAQPNGPPDYNATDKAAANSQPPRPVSRMNTASQRSQEDHGRPVNAVLAQGAKAPPKRPLQQEGGDGASRNPQARNGPSYQAKDAKRRRTSDDFFDELDLESQPPNIKGPPVRPSGGLKKDMSNKSMFSSGYANVPPQSASRDLFKATVTAQHHSAVKSTQPMDMSQFSKGAIPFAPNPNPAGPSHKTPARPQGVAGGKSAAKSATRSSPRFQNGESIELPEIDTDDEDEDEDDANMGAAAWADSPDLRRALARQETMDPSQIFGPPAPLVMEEVFSKSKDRWHKFRARTSSANWSGTDRLTEDEIRKDLVARDKMRKDGAWSYDMSKDLL